MKDRLCKIKMLAMDVDGTLTAGEMILFDGHQEDIQAAVESIRAKLVL